MNMDRNDFALPNSRDENPDHLQQRQALDIKRAEMTLINMAKDTIRKMPNTEGSIACPKCHKTMLFQFIPETNLFLLECSTKECIHIDELE